jgi:hypothetical protein
MYPSRMQELLSTVRSKFSSKGAAAEKDDSQEIGQLAEQIMEYGRLITPVNIGAQQRRVRKCGRCSTRSPRLRRQQLPARCERNESAPTVPTPRSNLMVVPQHSTSLVVY